MSHWLLDTMEDKRRLALREADRIQFYREMGRQSPDFDEEVLRETAAALEIAVLDLEVDRLNDNPEQQEQRSLSRQAAEDAFRLLRMLPLPTNPMRSEEHTSELQSRGHLVCRLLLEKKKKQKKEKHMTYIPKTIANQAR